MNGIYEFTLTPRPKGKTAKVLFFGLLAIAAMLVVLSASLGKYQGLVGLIAVCVATAAIVVCCRYLLVEYSYSVTFDHDGTPVFLVTSRTGKRISTLARVTLADVTAVDRETREERKKHDTPRGFVKYSYMPSIDPEVSYRLIESGAERAEILLELSEEAAALLLRFAAIAAGRDGAEA